MKVILKKAKFKYLRCNKKSGIRETLNLWVCAVENGKQHKATIPRETGRRKKTIEKNYSGRGHFKLNFHTDIVDSRLNWPRGQFREKLFEGLKSILPQILCIN